MSRAGERRAFVVVDLGFGDAGKGVITDFLVRAHGAHTVVRFNGGAQAGHNVVTPDGRHHTFSQLGAGTFVAGVRTHLARQVVVHPTALLVEAERLRNVGVPDALGRLSVSPDALVITPFHQAAGRLRELARGDARHGSCGVGVGETVADALETAGDAIRMLDLADTPRLRAKLLAVQERKRAELRGSRSTVSASAQALDEWRVLEDADVAVRWAAAAQRLLDHGVVVDDAPLAEALRAPGSVVFEGAQGVLLDEWFGFHPHTTWSTCTFAPALELLRDHAYSGRTTRLGVTRSYAVRHGAGPLPSEDAALAQLLPEPHNAPDAWQGAFRRGWLDLVLLRHALEACGGVDAVAMTHLDALARAPTWRAVNAYRTREGTLRRLPLAPTRDLEHQARLTAELFAAEPIHEQPPIGDEPDRARRWLEFVERELAAPVAIEAHGPRADKVSYWKEA